MEFETFRKFGNYDVTSYTQKEPSCFNGNVNIHKYKITVEVIAEPIEVLEQRLQKLWDECNNSHNVEPLRNAAKEIGYVFPNNSYGTKRK